MVPGFQVENLTEVETHSPSMSKTAKFVLFAAILSFTVKPGDALPFCSRLSMDLLTRQGFGVVAAPTSRVEAIGWRQMHPCPDGDRAEDDIIAMRGIHVGDFLIGGDDGDDRYQGAYNLGKRKTGKFEFASQQVNMSWCTRKATPERGKFMTPPFVRM